MQHLVQALQVRPGGKLGGLADVPVTVMQHAVGPAGRDSGGELLHGWGAEPRDAVRGIKALLVDEVAIGKVDAVLETAACRGDVSPRRRAGFFLDSKGAAESPTLHAVVDQRNAKLILNVVLGGDAFGYDLYRRSNCWWEEC